MRIIFLLLISAPLSIITSFSQDLCPEQLKFFHKNAKEISVDENYAEGNWKAVLKQVKNKEIVLIGELNHGSRENFLVRNDLIKYLHEKRGFNVILFEAGIGELYLLNRDKSEYSAKELTSGFFGIWRTMEFVDLMEYIKSEQLSIAGFDVQRSSGNAFKLLLKAVAEKYDLEAAQSTELEERFATLDRALTNRKSVYEAVEPKTKELIEAYQQLYELLQVDPTNSSDSERQFLLKTIENRVAYLNYRLAFLKNKDWRKQYTTRDAAMANNVIWLKENIYPNEKLIIVGHNFHLSQYNEKEVTAGTYLKEKYPDKIYAIGTFVGEGEYLDNSGKVKKWILLIVKT